LLAARRNKLLLEKKKIGQDRSLFKLEERLAWFRLNRPFPLKGGHPGRRGEGGKPIVGKVSVWGHFGKNPR